MARDGLDGLLDAARSGDPAAISLIWRAEQPRLLRVLRAEVGDAADDVASQTWLEVMGALSRFEGDERGFRALLFTIARRRVADHRRTQRRRPAVPVAPDALPEATSVGAVPGGGGFEQLGSDEAVAAITRLLSEEQAEVVLLRVVAGLSAAEVATLTGRTEGSVRVLQHRALKRLAEVVTRDGTDDL